MHSEMITLILYFSKLRYFNGKESTSASQFHRGTTEMGEPPGEEDSQEASDTRPICPIFSKNVPEGTAKPVHETAKQTASSK